MLNFENMEQSLIFGLDIGTRNVVGTVGYREEERFHVVAMHSVEHKTRSMLDGQIHDIGLVAKTITTVKEELEHQLGIPLHNVCIAAAGRVLKTVLAHAEYVMPEETVILDEHIHSLDLLGVEKAQDELNATNDTDLKFYCVGYTVIKYWMDNEIISNLEGHRAEKISEDVIVTFLPEDVVDGLYMACAKADLDVVNLTLEPIAAINLAIPQNYRMLNLAMVDVGAGTSDISITRDGSIIAYGMIPAAGDELTELLVQHYLVDFNTAEKMKFDCCEQETVEFEDIMRLKHEVPSEEVYAVISDMMEEIAKKIAEKILELNGGKPVSAVFIVGGGGKVRGFDKVIARELDIMEERVALRGEEVMDAIVFDNINIVKDPLLVTPVGICLNYCEMKNNFIFLHFNGERIKLYDNNHLTVLDAALEADFSNEHLFPKRGAELHFTVNGKQRMVRGEAGESAVITINGREVNMNSPVSANDKIEIIPSTVGPDAKMTIGELPEYSSTIDFYVNKKNVICPKFVEVNHELQSQYYEIQNGDEVEMLSYYTVWQLRDFMDVKLDEEADILVNNTLANLDEHVYENFSVEWKLDESYPFPEEELLEEEQEKETDSEGAKGSEGKTEKIEEETEGTEKPSKKEEKAAGTEESDAEKTVEKEKKEESKKTQESEKSQESEESQESAKSEESQEAQETGLSKETDIEKKSRKRTEQSGKKSKASDKSESRAAKTEMKKNKEEKKEPEKKETDRKVTAKKEPEKRGRRSQSTKTVADQKDNVPDAEEDLNKKENRVAETQDEKITEEQRESEIHKNSGNKKKKKERKPEDDGIFTVWVNEEKVTLTGKKDYIFVDIFDFYDFDLNDSRGRAIITLVNGKTAEFMAPLKKGDKITLDWKE